MFLSRPPVGTDGLINLISLRKADLSLLASLFNSGLDEVLTANGSDLLSYVENLGILNTTLLSIMACFDEYSDAAAQKLALSILTKLVYCWGGTASTEVPPLSVIDGPGKGMVGTKVKVQKENVRRNPLNGFDSFILEQILPIAFVVPLQASFNPADGQSLLIIGEIALLHKTISTVIGSSYSDYLCNVYLPTLNCPENLRREFVATMTQTDRKDFRKYLQSFFISFRKERNH